MDLFGRTEALCCPKGLAFPLPFGTCQPSQLIRETIMVAWTAPSSDAHEFSSHAKQVRPSPFQVFFLGVYIIVIPL